MLLPITDMTAQTEQIHVKQLDEMKMNKYIKHVREPRKSVLTFMQSGIRP